jgi:hypothetical protein
LPSFAVLTGVKAFLCLLPALVSQSLTVPRTSAEPLKDQSMSKLRLFVLAIASLFVVSTTHAAGFADAVIAYDLGSGFASGFTNASTVLGAPASTLNPFSPAFRNTQLLSIGAGGYLTVQFSTPIANDPGNPYGLDFSIFGNSGFIITNGNFSGGGITDGSLFGNNPGSTRISVSADNLIYYQLNPSLAPVVDGMFPTDGGGNFQLPVNPLLTGSDFAGQGLSGIRSLYNGSAGGMGYDIGWAQDQSGNSISLPSVNFVRVDVLSGKSEIDALQRCLNQAPSVSRCWPPQHSA